MKSFQSQTHYEVLEISVAATATEVRHAYERLSRLYSDDQVVLYGLVDPERAAVLRTRLKEALEVLTDERRRDAYDLQIGLPPRVSPAPPPRPSLPRAPSSGPSTASGWGSFSWVTPATQAAPATTTSGYLYGVAPTAPVAAPAPVLVVPAPARVVDETPTIAPVSSAPRAVEAPKPAAALSEDPAPVEPLPEPRQLALEVSVAAAGWPAQAHAPTAPPSAPGVVPVAPPAAVDAPPPSAPVVAPVAAAPAVVAAPLPSAPEAPVPAPLPSIPIPIPIVTAPPAPAPVIAAPAPAPDALPPPPPSIPVPIVTAPPASAPSFTAPPPEPAPPGCVPVPASSAPVAAPPPTPAAPPAVEASEAPVPQLADESVEVSIVPVRTAPSREFKVEQRPRPYEIPEGVEINGDLLRQVRMAKGLTLAQVADRTRIGLKHLENVEGDRYDALPASVYLRGILMSLARELGLDGLRVSKSYLTFVEAHRSKD